jgi:hypothetical protein
MIEKLRSKASHSVAAAGGSPASITIEARDLLVLIDRLDALSDGARYALGGIRLAYDAVEKKFIDEALLHLGHHDARLTRTLGESVVHNRNDSNASDQTPKTPRSRVGAGAHS